jgi:uncharacterized protein YihD (DUF1040 family)
MKNVITNYLLKASTVLTEQVSNLPDIKTFEIDCSQLKEFLNVDIRYSEEFKELFEKLMQIKGPCLYWYKIISDNTSAEIIYSLKEYKSKLDRSVPAIKSDKSIFMNSRILYVGKVKRDFYGRVIQHLGCHTVARTQGLQLNYWAKEIGLKLELNVMEFDLKMANILPVVEFAVANELNPLIGKHK